MFKNLWSDESAVALPNTVCLTNCATFGAETERTCVDQFGATSSDKRKKSFGAIVTACRMLGAASAHTQT